MKRIWNLAQEKPRSIKQNTEIAYRPDIQNSKFCVTNYLFDRILLWKSAFRAKMYRHVLSDMHVAIFVVYNVASAV